MIATVSLRRDQGPCESVHVPDILSLSSNQVPTPLLQQRYNTVRKTLTSRAWVLEISNGAVSAGNCGAFRPIIPLTDLIDLAGDALVGDDWFPCPEIDTDEDATAFLRAGFKPGFVFTTDTGVGIRLLSCTLENFGVDGGGVGTGLR